jgi:signal transduction histidine kinase
MIRLERPKLQAWFPAMPLLMSPSTAQLSPAARQLRAQLHAQLRQTIVAALLLLKTLLDSIVGVLLWYDSWAIGAYPPFTHLLHLVSVVSIVILGLAFLRYQRVWAALAAIIGISGLWSLGFIWITGEAGAFISIAIWLALPTLILSVRSLALISAGLYVGLLSLAQFNVGLQRNELLLAPLVVAALLVCFMIIGIGVRRTLDNLALIMTSREAEAAENARLSAQSLAVEAQHRRMLAAQHDLRAPCNTAMRITQLLQDQTLPTATVQSFVRRLEPLLLKLRTRIDATIDEAKAPFLEERRDLPAIDIAAVVAAHVPELRRWASIGSATDEADPPIITFEEHGVCDVRAREGEIHRILENLVLNSIAADARHISLHVHQLNANHVELIVEDDGAGFPEWLLSKPLQPTYAGRVQGIGLGLTGVTANVLSFHGSIALENWDNGARTRIIFPKAGKVRSDCVDC